jgi:hypothetical protein
VRRALAIVALAVAGWSCTFPTIAYEEACEVPNPPCNIDKYSNDGDQLRADRQTCIEECTGNPCETACQETYEDLHGDLLRDCELCSANNGCTKASADCLKWIEP